MFRNGKFSIVLVLICVSFLLAWNPLRPVFAFIANVFGIGTSIPLSFPEVNVDYTGKPKFSLSIQVPPGAGDAVPNVSLNYVGGFGNGILGKGWALGGLAQISKNPNLGIHFTSSDGYVSSQLGELLPTSTNGTYRSKMESFSKIRLESDVWTILDRSGITYEYGRNFSQGSHSVVSANGVSVSYYLDKVRDRFGNGYDITYLPETADSVEPLPQEIRYARGNARVLFLYGDRSDKLIEQIFSFTRQAERKKILEKIEVYANDASGSEIKSETYSFDYDTLEGESILSSFNRDKYKSIVFDYTQRNNSSSVFTSSGKTFSNSYQAMDPSIQSSCAFTQAACACTADWGCIVATQGNAILICKAGVETYQDICTNGMEMSFSSAADTDGDGTPELVRVLGGMDDQKFSISKMSDWETVSSGPISATDTRLGEHLGITNQGQILQGDFNGDGKTDFLVLRGNGVGVKIYYGSDLNSQVYSNVLVSGLGSGDSKTKQFVVDINGDGKTDFLQTDSNNKTQIYLSTGSGFQKSQVLEFSNYGTELQQFTDLDKNGIPDFLRIDSSSSSKKFIVTFLEYKSGQWATIEETEISRNNFGKSGDQFLSDLNGDGFPDFAFFSIAGSQGVISYYPFDGRKFLTNGASPYQTIEVNGAYANKDGQKLGPNSQKQYVEIDISGDGVKDRISYDSTDYNHPYFFVEIYDFSQTTYLPGFKLYWNTDLSTDLNGDGILDTIRANIDSVEEPDNEDADTLPQLVSTRNFQISITNGNVSEYPIDLADYSPPAADIGSVTDNMYFNWRNRKDFVDLNGDGKSDFLRYDSNDSILRVSYAISDSNGNITYSANGDDTWVTGGYFFSMDTNGDGKPEILGLKGDKTPVQSYKPSSIPFVGTTAYKTFPFESNLELHFIRFASELPTGLLKKIRNGSEAQGNEVAVQIDYELAKNHSGAIRPDLYDPLHPVFVPMAYPDYLAVKLSQNVGGTVLASMQYQYSFSRMYMDGFRNSSYIGFQNVLQTDLISNSVTKISYDPSFLEMAGSPTSQEKYVNGIKVSESSSNFTKSNSIFGGVLVSPNESTEIRYSDGQVLSTLFVTQTFDSYGNTLAKKTTVNGTQFTENTIFLNDWNASVLGKPIELQVLTGPDLVSHKKINYSNFMVSEIQEKVSSGVWRSQFIQAYDEYGNPTQLQDSNGNISVLEYDTVAHKYPVKTVNSFGHITLKTYDLTNGLELTSTDPNGGTAKTEYDDWGRAVRSYLPGETDWSEKIEYENVGDLENQLVRKVFRRSNGETWQEESSNMITRAVRKRSSLINGYVLVEETYKNPQGQTVKSVDSYIEGSNPFSWTEFTYGPEGNLIKTERNDGTSALVSMDGLNSTVTESINGNVIQQTKEIKNNLGQVISRTQQGKTIRYTYGSNGKISQIIDPENGTITIETDFSGRQTKVTNPNSGTVESDYDPNSGALIEQRFASGSKLQYTYDLLGRMLQVKGIGPQGETILHTYEYDSPSIPNGIGRLAKVTDSLGTTEFEYDIRGNQNFLKKTLTDEDLTFIVRKAYNLQNQIEQIVYPDGSIAKNLYSDAGYLSGITLTPGDGSGSDFPLVQYNGPIIEDGQLKIQRILGNGVKTDIFYDPIKQRPTAFKTGKDTEIYENIAYSYDDLGNYSSIEDKKNPIRSQSFVYDSINRLVSASGVYGTEEYQYSDSGKLLRKGNTTYSYADAAHKNAVTKVIGENITYDYAYDDSGNVTNRNDSTFVYDPFQKLKRMDTENQETILFDYDFTGTRIRKTKTSDGTKTITLGGLYEVVLVPGKSPQHTLYFRGNSGDLVGQWSRTDAVLVSETSASDSFGSNTKVVWNTFLWKFKDNTIRGIKYLFLVPGTNLAFLYITILLGVGFGLLYYQEGIWRATLKFTTPLLLVSFSNCSVLMPGGSGNPPWLIPPQYNSDTPTINNPYEPGGPGSGAGIPASGFIFLHSDHLGSVTMATDGNGSRIVGGDQGGASHISYKPYGEILRTDSSGPDVFRYKYTGQEEDKETGLYYYKARYYDPILGRFLQADSVINGGSSMGMDLYMYTEGNPVRYVDPSGHSVLSNWLSNNGLNMLNFSISFSGFFQRAFYISSARWSGASAGIAASMSPTFFLGNVLAIGGGAAAGASAIGVFAAMNALGVMAAGALVGSAAASMTGSTALALGGGAGALGSLAATFAGMNGLGLGAAAGFIGNAAASAGGATALAFGGGAFLLGAAASTALAATSLGAAIGTLSVASVTAMIAGALGIGVGMLATSLAFSAGALAVISGVLAVAVASMLVMAALAAALATTLVVFFLAPVLAATGIATGALAAGAVLSQITFQAYLAGGLSKSSLNNINWSEKDARTSACYAATGQFAAAAGGIAYFGIPAYGVLGYINLSADMAYWMGAFGTTKSAMTGDWRSVALDTISYYTMVNGLSTAYSVGSAIHNACGGSL